MKMFLIILTILLSLQSIESRKTPDFKNIHGRYLASNLNNTCPHDECKSKCANESANLLNIETPFELSDIIYALDPSADDCTSAMQTRIGGFYDKINEQWMWSRGYPVADASVDNALVMWCEHYPEPITAEELHSDKSKICLALHCKWGKTWCIINVNCATKLPYICERYSEPANPTPIHIHPLDDTPAPYEYSTPVSLPIATTTSHYDWQPYSTRSPPPVITTTTTKPNLFNAYKGLFGF